MDELNADLEMQAKTIAIVGDRATASDPKSATVVIEGTKILGGIDIPRRCSLLMGIIYALDLSYPKKLKYAFEVFQKLFLELDGLKSSAKVMGVKYSIF
ncbi:hypothetical protein LDENG_00213240 [Lucifuga dentata]|nr:hypothetical protein LDENG_00213240 [Lucifuga dentata]